MENEKYFETWAIVELLGHIRMAGLITEEELFGGKIGRVDIPNGDGFVTQYFGNSAIFRLTPCTEEAARAVSQHNQPRPVHRFELMPPEPIPEPIPKPIDHGYDDDWEENF